MAPTSTVIDEYRADLAQACRRFGVQRLELFGSAARGDFDPAKSDYDFIVRFADRTPGTYADRFFDFAVTVERLLGGRVDLLTERSIRNPYLQRQIEAERVVVYDERGQKEAV